MTGCQTSELDRAADISPDGVYRYRLWRRWGAGRDHVAFVLLNPSTADERVDDPTIRRCGALARGLGFSSMYVVNLFALRATDPDDLQSHDDPVGPDNDAHIADVTGRAALTIVGWGNRGTLAGRDAQVLRVLRRPHALAITRRGSPGHPLYLPAGARPRPFAGPDATATVA